MERDLRLEAVRRGTDALLDVRGRVLRRQGRLGEAATRRRRAGEAIQAKRAPARATAVPRDQVPAASAVDQRVRLDLPAACDPVATPIRETEALEVTAGGRDDREMLRVDGRTGRGKCEGRRTERTHSPAQVARQDLLQ